MEEFTFDDLSPSTSSSTTLSTTITTTTTTTTITSTISTIKGKTKNLKRRRNNSDRKKKQKKTWWNDFCQDDDNDNDNEDTDDDLDESNDNDSDKESIDSNTTSSNTNVKQQSSSSSFMLPHETPEQVLERTDLVRKTRKENLKLFSESVQCYSIGSDEYNTAYEEYCAVAQSRALEVFFKGDETLLSAAIVKSRRWFEQLSEQFVEVPMLFGNTSYFGNVMTTFALDMQLIANPGHLFDIVALLSAVASCAYAYNERQSPWALLAGDASVGKSYLMKQIESTLPPGVVAESMHRSSLVLTSPSNADCQLLLDEEASGALIGTDNRKASKTGSTLMKNYMTNKIVISERMIGGRKQRAVTSQMGTGILATNDALPDANHPLLARYLVLTPESLPSESDESIARKLNKLVACDHSSEVARSIARERLIQFYIMLVEQLIAMRALRDVNMDAYSIYWSCVSESLAKSPGFYRLDNTKKLTTIRWLVRSLVIRKAVCTVLFSEYFAKNRINMDIDDPERKYCRFLNNWHVHLRNIDRLLVAEEPEIVFGISMCAPLFANSLEVKLLRLLRDIIFVELCHRNNGGNNNDDDDNDLLSSIDVESHRFLHFAGSISYDYVGLSLNNNRKSKVPADVPGYNLTMLANSLITLMCDGKPPLNSTIAALVNLTKTDITFDRLTTKMQPRKVLCIDTTSSERITGPILRTIRVGSNTSDVRIFVSVHALLAYCDVAETIKKVLVDNMAHRFQLSATHVINSQYIGTRIGSNDNNIRQANSWYRFNGIYDTIQTAANQSRVHEFINYNTMSTSQFEAISKHSTIISQCSTTSTTSTRQSPTAAAAYWVDDTIDSAAFQAHQHMVAATMTTTNDNTNDLYWYNFQHLNNSARQNQSNLFSNTNWQYPQHLIAERQSRNAQVDLSRSSTIDTRMTLLPPISSLVMANVKPSLPLDVDMDSARNSF